MKFLKWILATSLCCASILMLNGCQEKEKSEASNEKTEEKKVEKFVELVKNDRYVEPLNAYNEMKLAFNELSASVSDAYTKEEAINVGKNFVFDFFTLQNKQDQEDIGGLQYIPSDSVYRYEQFAKAYYYGNYPTIVNEYGKEALPKVLKVDVLDCQPSEFEYNDDKLSGYLLQVQVTYAQTELPIEKMKTTMQIKVMKIEDFAYSRSHDYSDPMAVFDGDMKDTFRVMSVE